MRNKFNITYLYYLYHFSYHVREKGKEIIKIKVRDEYIKAVNMVQKALQGEVAAKGIAIETNLSSNYLIGTFKHYDEYPIVNFYNNGLTTDYESLAQSLQIWVSINTDDQGIFGTTLENEYAFMARALEKKKNDNDERIYQKALIYEWLESIRKMGIMQSFGYEPYNK